MIRIDSENCTIKNSFDLTFYVYHKVHQRAWHSTTNDLCLARFRIQLIWRPKTCTKHFFLLFSESRHEIASIFHLLSIITLHCSEGVEKNSRKKHRMQFWSPLELDYALHICGIAEPEKEFLCNFVSGFCAISREIEKKLSNGKNAMNNFKVQAIKQQWGIIKHQAALSSHSIAISNRATQCSLRYWTIFSSRDAKIRNF